MWSSEYIMIMIIKRVFLLEVNKDEALRSK